MPRLHSRGLKSLKSFRFGVSRGILAISDETCLEFNSRNDDHHRSFDRHHDHLTLHRTSSCEYSVETSLRRPEVGILRALAMN